MVAEVSAMSDLRANSVDAGEAKNLLLDFLGKRSFRMGQYTLSSGEQSDYYIDGKKIELSGEGLSLFGDVFWEVTKGLDFNAISGLATGSISLTAAAVLKCYANGRPEVEGTFVRSEVKEHGTRREIEGELPPNAKVIVLDDVVTSGASVMKAIEALVAAKATVVKVIALVDRQEGAKEFLQKEGYEYVPIFTRDDLFERFRPNKFDKKESD